MFKQRRHTKTGVVTNLNLVAKCDLSESWCEHM